MSYQDVQLQSSPSRECYSANIIQQGEVNNNRLGELCKRLNQVSVRLAGPRPVDKPPGIGGGTAPMAPTLMMRLDNNNSQANVLLGELEEIISSIEKFV